MYNLNQMNPDVYWVSQNLLNHIKPALVDHESQLNKLKNPSNSADQDKEIAWLFQNLISLKENCDEWGVRRQLPDDVANKTYSSKLECAKAMGDLCDESNKLLTIHQVIKAHIEHLNNPHPVLLEQEMILEQPKIMEPKEIVREIQYRTSSINHSHGNPRLSNAKSLLESFDLERVNIINEGEHAGLPGYSSEMRNAHENEIILELLSFHPPQHQKLKVLSLSTNLLQDWVFINKLVHFGYNDIEFKFFDWHSLNHTQEYVKLSNLIKTLISWDVIVDCTSNLSYFAGQKFHCITAFEDEMDHNTILEAKELLDKRSFLYATSGEKSHIYEKMNSI